MVEIISEAFGFFILFFVLLFLSAFFAGAETALISVNKIRLSHAMQQGRHRAKIAHYLVLHLDRLITTILVCNNLANIAMASIGTAFFIKLLGPENGILVSTLTITIIVLIFGEISPKVFSSNNAYLVSLIVAYPMYIVIKVLSPIVWIFMKVGHLVIRAFGGKPRTVAALITEEELRYMAEAGKEEGIYGEVERRMLHRIFKFGDLRVEDVMIPLKDVHAVPVSGKEKDLFEVCVEEGHSRVPVYKDENQNIVGIVYTKDLLHLMLNDQLIKIPDVLHEPYFIPPMMKVTTLLKEFLQKKLQIAIVGYRSRAVGLVTLEDLLEEIVGEIDEVSKRPPDA